MRRRSRLAAAFALGAQSLFCAGVQAGGPPEVKPGEPFELRVGEKASVAGGALVVTFVGVTEDSRCPKGEQCIVAGRARLSLEAAPRDGAAVRFELDTARQTENEIGGYFITLLGLEPVRVSGRPISPQDYVARLSIGGSSSGNPANK